jgi:mono/diheme cytochrome c family protein
MKPDVLENTIFGGLFDARVTTPQAIAFREDFVKQVKTLVIPNVNLYTLNIPAQFLVPDTQPTLEDEQPGFITAFTEGLSTTAGLAFRDAIEAESRKAGSTLGANLILTRVVTQNCAGCHFGGIPVGDGINFPLAIRDFQQVTEDQVITGEGGPESRFAISGAMSQVFIPHRMQILRDYLATGKAPVHSN